MESWKLRFFSIWSGQSLSLIGSVAAQFALVWWVTQKTGSGTVLATASLFSLLPSILLRPFAGVLVDRMSRRMLLIASDSFIALVSLWLAYLFWADSMQIWHVYVVMLLRSIGSAFHESTMYASVTMLVPKEHFARVSGLNSFLGGGLNVVGPLLGALLVAILPLHVIMALDFVTAAFALLPLCIFSIPQPASISAEGRRQTRFWDDFREGLRYMTAWRGLIALTGLILILNFALMPTYSLIPLLVVKVYKGNAILLSSFNSAMGLGMLCGGALLGIWGGFKRKISTTLVAAALIGVAMIVAGSMPTGLWSVALGAVFVWELLHAIANGCLSATFRVAIDPSMQGRIGALMGSSMKATIPLGLLVAGPVADAIGVRTWFFVAAGLLIIGGFGGLLLPQLRHIEEEAKQRRESLHAGAD